MSERGGKIMEATATRTGWVIGMHKRLGVSMQRRANRKRKRGVRKS